MSDPINQQINNFLTYLEHNRQASALTINNYKFYLSRFYNLTKINSIDQINIESINSFRSQLSQIRNQRGGMMKLTTQNYHLIALRTFLNYLKTKGLSAFNPDKISLNKTKKETINALEKNNMEKLLQAPLLTKSPDIIKTRDKSILELLLSTGLKVSELASLRRNHINFMYNVLTIKGMGGRFRTMELNNHAKFWINKYLEMRTDSLPALFIRHDKAKSRQLKKINAEEYQLTPRTVQRIIKKYAKSSELNPNITPQTLRHSYAKYLLATGEDLKHVQSKLGHASIITTHMYTRGA
ncbi:tyrosine-type recombinase/integrase [Patescibacteria group bacterium]|nr:tyrosine-type recombinase/integrase [Patescibacteria group bacterium]MBU0964318.1 tyrosine-type recombinase/integrase [Patescibacteria group bacterium]